MDLLQRALRQPQQWPAMSLAEWDLVVRQARHADLLARLAATARACGRADALPSSVRLHADSALMIAQRQHKELVHEVDLIRRALAPVGVPVVLLKGAAYVLQGLQAAQGRLVSDVDILVPRERLADVESALMIAGWVSTHRDAYDQHYYRTWMHELPPLKHMSRGTALDVHHAILPPTTRLRPDSADLLSATIAVGGHEDVRTLSHLDMVLHSAAHLFHESELPMGLRGLVDLDALLGEFSTEPGFWDALLARAQRLRLEPSLAMALRYTARLLGTPVPPDANERLALRLREQGLTPRWGLMDALYGRALLPPHSSTADAWTPLAHGLLYLRGHWLRMPPGLLARHLLRKALLSPLARRSEG